MNDDPQEIAKKLIAEYGSPQAALDAAIEGAAAAHASNDLYSLSIWRDLKRLLTQRVTAEVD